MESKHNNSSDTNIDTDLLNKQNNTNDTKSKEIMLQENLNKDLLSIINDTSTRL